MTVVNEPVLETVRLSGDAGWSMPDLAGDTYELVLDRFHRILTPKTYLEIGVAKGGTLRLARCPTIAIDPVFMLEKPLIKDKKVTMFFEITSDEFFAKYSPSNLFGHHVEMAFLDGMHLYEYLLRDFINLEKFCTRNSIVFLHDCIPVDSHIARRVMANKGDGSMSRHPDWWTGDVWKAVAILKKHRPDLSLHAFDAVPTGLIAITNLDPSSTTLSNGYFQIIEEFRNTSLREEGERYISSLDILSTRDVASLEKIACRFWL